MRRFLSSENMVLYCFRNLGGICNGKFIGSSEIIYNTFLLMICPFLKRNRQTQKHNKGQI